MRSAGGAFRIFPLLVLATLCAAWHPSAPRSPLSAVTIFDSDPNHIWNRTYACLFVRQSADGTEYGADALDPPLWGQTRHLLIGASHRRALTCLDAFVRSHAESAVQDPLKRAILQHDLWAVFDWVAAGDDLPQERRELEVRLAEAIRRLALQSEQARALPDTYAAAMAAHQFAPTYDPRNPQQPFLPVELFRSSGPWVCLSAHTGEPTAMVHFSGRSRFLVFMRLPGGRDATLDYIQKVRSSSAPALLTNSSELTLLNLALPQFPVGAQVALVRQVIVIDNQGKLVPTELTESVQLRVYHAITAETRHTNYINGPSSHDQDFFELRMSRPALFAHHAGGLVMVRPTDREFATFSTHGVDAFESASIIDGESVVLERCRFCHSDSGIYSVQSRLQWIKPLVPSSQVGQVDDAIAWESYATITRKEHEADFKVLQSLWQGERR